MVRPFLIAALAIAATPALAEPETPISTAAPADAAFHAAAAADGAMTTLAQPMPPPQAAAPVDTAAQIEAFLRSAPPVDVDDGVPIGTTGGAVRDDKIHGMVEASVGSHGYRSVYAQADMPVGESGRLSIAVEQSRGRGPWGYGYGYGYGAGGYGYGPGGYGGGYGGGISRWDSGTRNSIGLGLSFGTQANRSDRCQRPPLDPAGRDILTSGVDRCDRDLGWGGR